MLREHRIYQADWLLRYYGVCADELLDESNPNFSNIIDPKSDWALRHKEIFPLEINRAPYELLLRVPGLGVKSARKIVMARRHTVLRFEDLKKMRVSMKRAKYFITCAGRTYDNLWIREELITPRLLADNTLFGQMNLLDMPTREDYVRCQTGEM